MRGLMNNDRDPSSEFRLFRLFIYTNYTGSRRRFLHALPETLRGHSRYAFLEDTGSQRGAIRKSEFLKGTKREERHDILGTIPPLDYRVYVRSVRKIYLV